MKYEVENKELGLIVNKVKIPNYQRKYVWDKGKQARLIESLLLHYPIGIFTSYIEEEKYVILDGLQRFTTIENFQRQPSNILTFKRLVNTLQINFDETSYDEKTYKKVERMFRNWYEQLENIAYMENDTAAFQDYYLDELKIDMQSEKINRQQINEQYKKIVNNIQFMTVKVPIIICQEFEESELSDVFEKMNTGSMKLSKYEVYVAQWDDYPGINFSKTMSKLIKDDIKNRSTELHDKFDIEVLNNDQNNTYRIFEYFLAISSLVAVDKYGFKGRTDSFGYEIISLLLINNVYGVNDLVKKNLVKNGEFPSEIGTFLEELYLIIKEALTELEDVLNQEIEKFAKYFRLINYINVKYVIDLDRYIILTRKINSANMELVLKFNHKFKDERQVSYLQNLISEVKNQYIISDEVEEKIKVKILKVTDTFIPGDEKKLRIQVRPEIVRLDIKKGSYNEIFGTYSDFYIKFNMDQILLSKAIRKSLYVYIDDIDNFKNSGKKVEEIFKGNATEIMTEDYFKKKYCI